MRPRSWPAEIALHSQALCVRFLTMAWRRTEAGRLTHTLRRRALRPPATRSAVDIHRASMQGGCLASPPLVRPARSRLRWLEYGARTVPLQCGERRAFAPPLGGQ
eukprot:COSAG01_NODE_286_length_19421_cov_123.895663_21_plen_105_part_00